MMQKQSSSDDHQVIRFLDRNKNIGSDFMFKRSFSSHCYDASAGSGIVCKKKQRAPSQPQIPPVCQVEGCSRDLRDSKGYHRRHRVCELHSKSPKNVVDGIEQRFCQQCSRFHLLEEFDDGKRSCRKRLAGHNQRRRKPPVEALLAASSAGKIPVVINPGDFKVLGHQTLQQQQQQQQQQQHLLNGSFLTSWPENHGALEIRERSQESGQIYRSGFNISPVKQQDAIYQLIRSYAPAIAPISCCSSDSIATTAVPPCSNSSYFPLGAMQGGALSLLSGGQNSSNASEISASGVLLDHPRLAINNSLLYKRPMAQVDPILQPTTTAALDMFF